MHYAEQPMILVGADVFTREDGHALVKMLEKIAIDNGVMRPPWNGFNLLSRFTSLPGALDIGLGPLPHKKRHEILP